MERPPRDERAQRRVDDALGASRKRTSSSSRTCDTTVAGGIDAHARPNADGLLGNDALPGLSNADQDTRAYTITDDYDAPSVPVSLSGQAQLDVMAQLAALYYQGIAPKRLHAMWREHVLRNRMERPSIRTSHVWLSLRAHERHAIAQPSLEEFFKRNPVCVVDDLGDHLSVVCFTGPHSNIIFLSTDALKDTVTLTFQVLEIFMHYVLGHVRADMYDLLVEFRRDTKVPNTYLTPRYGDIEGTARSAAACLWSDEYSESVLGSSVDLRAALRHPGVSAELIRWATCEKASFREQVQALLSRVPGALADRLAGHPAFLGPVAVVKAPDDEDINAYLLQVVYSRDGSTTQVCRRWIPSVGILECLGVSLQDVVRIPWDDLSTYPEETMLIDPKEVRAIAAVLTSTRSYSWLNRLRSYKARLAGVLDLASYAGTAKDKQRLAPPRRRPPVPFRFGGYRRRGA